MVTVTETVPSGLSLDSMTGTGWNCSGNTCTRSDALAGGNSYPTITVLCDVAANAVTPQINTVTLSGGGSASMGNYDTVAIYTPPSLSIAKTHTASFAVGLTNLTYNVTVSNQAGAAPSSGLVTVTDILPPGLSLVSMAGLSSTWSCTGSTCTRSDALAGGTSYDPITVTVNVASNATSPQVNQVTVSGGGSPGASASDSTVINSNPPVLSIASSHSGNFYLGQYGATYTLTVSNQAGTSATTGTVTVTDPLPSGLQYISATGTGWYCSPDFSGPYCARSDPLSPGNSYPPITVTLNVNYYASSTLVNRPSVSGGGALSASGTDSTTISPEAVMSITCTQSGSFAQGANGTYTLVVSDQAGTGPNVYGAMVTETLPAGLSLVSMSGTGWTCGYGSCSRNDNINGGSSYAPITASVSVSPTAGSPLTYSVQVIGSGFNAATATDSTVILPHAPAVVIQSNVTGAPFSLDNGTVYQTPYTFYWAAGEQHTVTWLTAMPGLSGARYSFQSWADGGNNPRTFAGGNGATYTANIAAQFQLTLTISNAIGGTIVITPASPDGYYNNGQSVTLTPTAASGYVFGGFTGVPIVGLPQTVTMSSPQAVSAVFACAYKQYGPSPYPVGSGPQSGVDIWNTGAGCLAAPTSSVDWMTIGSPTVVNGFIVAPYSVAANTGGIRDGEVSFNNSEYNFGQDAAPSATPNLVSLSPSSGIGNAQIFSVQAYLSAGYTQIGRVDLVINSISGSRCYAAIAQNNGVNSLYLVSDSDTFLGPLDLPGTGALQNSVCTLSAAGSSLSGSGQTLTANFSLAFTSAFTGNKYITGQALDVTETLGTPITLGTWAVPSSACDVDGFGTTNMADVQSMINQALGISPAANDLNQDGVVNVADVQIVIGSALGSLCATK
jgi:uncharacterized repeat protein (TIGR01451 family)